MKATAVIGANFGDEGKGLMVDYFARANGVVVRHNGGAQAGHTVCTPEGRRHIFHHFGAGTFRGAATYLGRHFVVNPLLWQKEVAELGAAHHLLVHPDAMVTTPYDMLINQAAEQSRRDLRHGSCGIGINETYERHRVFPLSVSDLAIPGVLAGTLQQIRRHWVPSRVQQLLISVDAKFGERVRDDSISAMFTDACEQFRINSETSDHGYNCPFVVFEGAQGLLLDEDHRFFPHVTRGHPGLRNVADICRKAGIEMVEAVYVTRPYMTRHGPGPFPTEDESLVYRDDTNTLNEFQGALRFGRLDFDLLAESIHHDLENIKGLACDPCIAVTHLDQIAKPVECVAAIERATELRVRYKSFGPTRIDILCV